MDACRRATCDSSAMVSLAEAPAAARGRNQVAAADTPKPIAAPRTHTRSCAPPTPCPSNMSHNARSASGSAGELHEECRGHEARFVAITEFAQPPHGRDHGGAAGPTIHHRCGEDVIGDTLLVVGYVEALRLRTVCDSVRRAPSAHRAWPSSTTRPCSSTQMRSAWLIGERCGEMRIVVQWLRRAGGRRFRLPHARRVARSAHRAGRRRRRV